MYSGRTNTSRALVFVTGLAAPVLLFGTLCLAQGRGGPAKAESAGKKFKNVRVLKDLPADQLIPVMRSFGASLGLRCDACHVMGPDHSGFEKDDKRMKVKARQMLAMVNTVNKTQKVVEGKVTCFMCHRGQPEPQGRADAGEGRERD